MKRLANLAAAIALAILAAGSAAAEWKPSGPIKILIGFRAGGGVDTSARLLAEELTARHGWKIIPENVTGKGGAIMAAKLRSEPNDGLTWGMTPTEALTYTAQALKNPGYGVNDFTYLSSITGTQMALVAKADRGWKNLGDVFKAMRGGQKISAGSMSPKLSDGLYAIGKANGVEFNTVNVKGGRGGLNGILADDLDISWVAGIQTKGVLAGDLVNLVSAETYALKASPSAPMLSEYNVPFTFGTLFLVMAPKGISRDARETIEKAVAEIVEDPNSKLNQYITKAFSGPIAITGKELDDLVMESYEDATSLIEYTSS